METIMYKRLNYDFSFAGKGSFCLDLDLNRFSHQMIYEETNEVGCYEKDLSIVMGALLKEGDMVIDVGAHIGYVTMSAAIMVGSNGSVFAFEPVKENIDHILHNLSINGIENVSVEQLVVSDSVGNTPFYYNRDNDGGHALWDVGRHRYNVKSRQDPCILSFPMTTLDHHFASTDLSRLKIIKIDTEGNEVNVLNGARRIIESHRVPCIVCELNKYGLKQMGNTENDLRDLMLDYDYERFIFKNDTLMRLAPNQYIKSNHIINLFFFPRESVTDSPATDQRRSKWTIDTTNNLRSIRRPSETDTPCDIHSTPRNI